jgi:hypothetical protein
MAYIYPDGSVTGSIHWDSLRESVANRDQDGVTDEGWERLDALVKEHDDAVKGEESQARERAKAAAKANVEAGALEPANTPTDDDESEEEQGLTKAELQDALRERGLPTSGNKAELQQRLDESEEEVG